jgi:hypothetical protein
MFMAKSRRTVGVIKIQASALSDNPRAFIMIFLGIIIEIKGSLKLPFKKR